MSEKELGSDHDHASAISLALDGKSHADCAPEYWDLAKSVHFQPHRGMVLLDEQRMVLMHASSLSVLRQELARGQSMSAARGVLTRMGYLAGARDAEMARKLRASASDHFTFLAGPQLVALQGIVKTEQIALDINVANGRYHAAFHLIDCVEADAHLAAFGLGEEPACWMLMGYACGHSSAFMGRPILWREIECRAQGHDRCLCEGRPIEEWGEEAQGDLRYLQIGEFVKWTPSPTQTTASLSPTVHPIENEFGMVGISAGFKTVCHLVKRAAPTDATVMFLGESGVGKEIFSQNLHRLSKRSGGPFIAVNCAAIPEQLAESELFGVERGGYTGAVASRPGRFERAHEGTLFLDEIGTLSFTAQGKLLRALQQGEIERVGDTKVRKVDVRLIAATNVNLREAVKAGTFREDLFYRLNVIPISVPAVRDRRDDIPLLMNWFMQRACKKHSKIITGFEERAVDAMLAYHWPGNVREMENLIERAVILADDGAALDISNLFTTGEEFLPLDGQALAGAKTSGSDQGSSADLQTRLPKLADLEAELLSKALREAKGNLAEAARRLGISRATLAYRLRKHKLDE